MRNRFFKIKIIGLILVFTVSLFSLTGCVGLLAACVSVLDDEPYEIESDAPKSNSTFSNEKYAYNTLDEHSKKVYDELYEGIVNMEDEIEVSTSDENEFVKVTECIDADHSDIFYVDGYGYYEGGLFGGSGFNVAPNYTMTRQERDAKQAEIDNVVNSWLTEISPDASDYEKSKWVYETLINRADYVMDSPDNQNIISVFLNGQTVCQGYSAAACYLFDRLGIQSCIVPGYAEEGPHAWNLVLLDGQYYFMDITWGNTAYEDSTQDKRINYSSLNVTSEDIAGTHRIESSFPIPECFAIDDNYYNQEGCYFVTFEPERMGKLLHNGYVSGKDVSIKCGNQETYDKMKKYFIDDTHFTDYCGGARTLEYTMYPEDRIITFHFG